MVTGGCLCGAIEYEIDGQLHFARNCHCSMCRRATGAAFATWAYVEKKDFRLTKGQALLVHYPSSPGIVRTFCQVCGSTLQYIAEQDFPDAFGLALGTVDGHPGCRPMRHVMVGSKAAWFEITDDLPQSESAPDE
ncbi:GFA family protein [Methylocaldum sp.]|uniref:GFA family protein n=1 Tax=Methylocaldum sp. TaxID=1969727 RepID=UPI002D6A8BE6|nr:GFA family protein [Methylocaldum sp.]HYE36461.1 GFA family protein [Methylocaldum sp.]